MMGEGVEGVGEGEGCVKWDGRSRDKPLINGINNWVEVCGC